MDKKYISSAVKRDARPRSKRLREQGTPGGTGSGSLSIMDLNSKLDKSVWATALDILETSEGIKFLYIKIPVVTAEGITMYGADGTPISPSIFDGLPIDNKTIGWVDGALTVIGGTGDGEGTVKGIILNEKNYDPAENGYITLPDVYSKEEVDNKIGVYSAKVDNFLEGSDTDGIINKWKELEAFLAGQSQTSTLAELLSVKADKATTLVGYGITDAYTKEELNTKFLDYVTLTTAQTISGVKDFTNGIKIGSIPVTKHSNGILEIDGDLLVTGNITMFAQGSQTASTIMDGVAVDGTTIIKESGRLKVIGGGAEGTVKGIIFNEKTYDPAENGYVTLPDLVTTVKWEDVKEKPTTIAGYGITDAYTKDQISTELGKYVTLATAQEVSGVKDFTTGIKIGSIPVVKHSSGILEIDGDLIVTGAITMFAQGSQTASTILDAIPIDTSTLSKTGGKLSVIGGGLASVTVKLGTTAYDSVDGVVSLPAYPTTLPASDVQAWAKAASKPTYAWSEIISKPSWIGSSKPDYSWSEISSKPTWIGTTKPSYSWSEITSKPSWIGSSKPSYLFSEITSKPTTISGYGITDGFKKVALTTSAAPPVSGDVFQGGYWHTVGGYASFVQDNYGGQLQFNGNNMYYRYINNGSAYAWGKLLSDINYTSTMDSRYIKKSGDTMTGDLTTSLSFISYQSYINQGYSGSAWNNGAGAYNVKIINNSNQTPLILAYRNTAASDTGANRLFSMELLNSGTTLRFYMGGSQKMVLLNNGYLGIGVDSPGYLLHVNGSVRGNTFYVGQIVTPSLPSVSGSTVSSVMTSQPIIGYLNNDFTVAYGSYVPVMKFQTVTSAGYRMRYIMGAYRDGGGVYGASGWRLGISTNDTGSTQNELQLNADGNLQWVTNSNGAFVLRAAGSSNVALSCSSTNPYLRLILGSVYWYAQAYNGYMYLGNGTTNSIRIDSTGNLLSPQGITMYSDIRKKNIISPLSLPLDRIANAPSFRYTFKGDREKHVKVGTSAQYWLNALPEVIGLGEDNYYTLDPGTLAVACSISIAKHLMEHLRKEDERDKKIRELEQRINYLERRA